MDIKMEPVPRGEWIRVLNETYGPVGRMIVDECSICNKTTTRISIVEKMSYKYCPHCGAKMKVE